MSYGSIIRFEGATHYLKGDPLFPPFLKKFRLLNFIDKNSNEIMNKIVNVLLRFVVLSFTIFYGRPAFASDQNNPFIETIMPNRVFTEASRVSNINSRTESVVSPVGGVNEAIQNVEIGPKYKSYIRENHYPFLPAQRDDETVEMYKQRLIK